MKFHPSLSALSWWTAVLVLAGCGGKPPSPPGPDEPRLTTVSVTCTPSALTAGQSAQCSASAVDQNGDPFSVTSFTWTSGDEAIARVDSSGKVATANISSGSVAIRARAADSTLQGEASLAVTPKPPTVHSTPVTSAETWKAQDNPHLVTGALSVDAALSLEAGVVIRFASDAELKVARGAVQAAGTAQAPVLLQAEKGGKGAWKGVVLAAKDTASSLEFVTLSGCGSAQGAGACLVIRDGAVPVLKDVTVKDSGSLGVLVATADSAFGPGSTRLSVSNSTGAAVRLPANQAGTLPTGGAFTGNTPNVVDLTGATVTRTQTWPNPGIPYLITEKLLVNDNTEASVVTLTVAAGTQVRFGPGVKLIAGVGNADSKPGALVLEGTAEAPILLTAHSDTPQPGSWRGVHVRGDAANRFSHVTIEYAGQAPVPDDQSTPFQGNLNLYPYSITTTSRTTITDLLVRKSGGLGLYTEVDLLPGLVRLESRDNATYPIEMLANSVGNLPASAVFQNNGINMVSVLPGDVTRTQTWPNLGAPYRIQKGLSIGAADKPTLTIAPGTEFRLMAGAFILVGALANQPGALVASGTGDTTATSIRFVPDITSAQAGYWSGIHFWYATGSKLDHVLVTHGGAKADPTYKKFIEGPSNVSIYTNGLGEFVTNSRFEQSSTCATARRGAVTTRLFAPANNNRAANNNIDEECISD